MDLLGNNFDPRLLLAVVVLVGLLVWETVQPYIAQFARDRVGLKNRGRHAAWNLGVGIVNSVMVALFFVWLWQASTQWASTSGFGLLNLWELPASARLFAAVILLDFWTYWWHRLNHRLPILWRFHRFHHADQTMDVTTGSRFHMVEIGLSSFLRVPVLIALGATMGELAVYEISMFLVVLFHHANIALLERADRTLRLFIVTPMMNKVHHSIRRVEADSNYGSLFTWWDRWFGSWKILQAGRRIQFGVEE
jgi:sterol desaturase/sphingolipid hydroxylase (fatty acid hydroxylase superfamily)